MAVASPRGTGAARGVINSAGAAASAAASRCASLAEISSKAPPVWARAGPDAINSAAVASASPRINLDMFDSSFGFGRRSNAAMTCIAAPRRGAPNDPLG